MRKRMMKIEEVKEVYEERKEKDIENREKDVGM